MTRRFPPNDVPERSIGSNTGTREEKLCRQGGKRQGRPREVAHESFRLLMAYCFRYCFCRRLYATTPRTVAMVRSGLRQRGATRRRGTGGVFVRPG